MKKNISINISGIIFHIEEDGFDTLKEYLESINKYFSTFDDSREIIEDIENRIAEIFLAKLKDGKQVITMEDVESLKATMGSIQDFQSVEEEQTIEEPKKESKKEERTFYEETQTTGRKLYRDKQRKLLGGVLSGLANYFKIDPIWLRLLYLILFFNIFIAIQISGALLLIYVILWIVLPGSEDLEDTSATKKMFRDQENRVLGGVASGVAAYFGVDITVIRVLFFISIFLGGSGLILYIILWIIIPEAKTISEKVQMQGEPVTLSNIETNVKKSLNVDEENENVFVKILLFPFRLIAMLIEGLSKALGPIFIFIVDFIRVIIGLVIILVSICCLIAIIAATAALLGLISTSEIVFFDVPVELFGTSLSVFTAVILSIVLFLPFLGLTILGFSVVLKRRAVGPAFGWSLLAVFVLCIIGLLFTLTPVINDFKEDGDYEETISYTVPQNQVTLLEARDNGSDTFTEVRLILRGHDETDIKLVKNFYAKGRTREVAEENAQLVMHGVKQKDSVLIFDTHYKFTDESKFRFQGVDMELYIPYDREFVMEEEMDEILEGNVIPYDAPRNSTWKITRSAGLICLDCEDEDEIEEFSDEAGTKEFNIKGFSAIELGSIFKATIRQSDEFRVVVSGRQEDIDDIEIDKDADKLSIYFEDGLLKNWKHSSLRREVELLITMPSLNDLEMHGAAEAYIINFEENEMKIELDGAAQVDLESDIEDLIVDLDGASSLKIFGQGRYMNAELSDGATLEAFDFELENAVINTKGASKARVNVSSELEVDAEGLSQVRYEGNPDFKQINTDGLATVKRK